MTRASRTRCVLMLLACVAGPASAVAQTPSGDRRLDESVTRAVETVMRQARADGLPIEPLWSKAIEGASKGADSTRILDAVRRLRDRMRRSATALGSGTTDAELVAAAAVLDVSVPEASLTSLRKARPGRSMASALVGLVFLVQRGTPVDRAVGLVRDLLIADVTETDFTRFWRLVEHDMRAGASAAGAAEVRARAWIRHGVEIRGVTPEIPW